MIGTEGSMSDSQQRAEQTAHRAGANDDQRMRLARYFAENHLPYTAALKTIVERGPDSLLATSPDLLAV